MTGGFLITYTRSLLRYRHRAHTQAHIHDPHTFTVIVFICLELWKKDANVFFTFKARTKTMRIMKYAFPFWGAEVVGTSGCT